MLRKVRRYSWRLFLGDCFGGAIAALIALPYGLSLAAMMGLPPVLGILTSVLTAPVTALLGRNPVLIGGTASVTVPFISAAVKQQGIGGAAKVSIVASVLMMAFCVLRLGRHVSRVPHAVVSGFSCGIGGIMVISQLHVILGIEAPPAANPLLQLFFEIARLRASRFAPLLIGGVVILTAALCTRWAHRLPAPLIGVVFAFLAARLFSFHEPEVGSLPLTMPPLVGFAWAPSDSFTVLPSALGLAFVTSVNLLLTSRVVEHFRGRHQFLKSADADAELGAYGIANICAGMFGAPMSVGIPARSVANVRCGATTRLSNLMHAVFLCAMVWFGAGLVAQVPLAALAGVTAWMGFCLLDWSTWHRLPRMRVMEASAFLITAIGVLIVNAVVAVLAGCSLYLGQYLYERFIQHKTPVPAEVEVAE